MSGYYQNYTTTSFFIYVCMYAHTHAYTCIATVCITKSLIHWFVKKWINVCVQVAMQGTTIIWASGIDLGYRCT